MGLERTFSIIKPDATRRNLTGKINAKFEDAGLRVVAQKRIHMTKAQAGKFYEVHSERPFYDELCEFMSSEPVIVQVLEEKMLFQRIEKLWVRQTQQMRLQELYGLSLQRALEKTLFMVLMLQRLLLLKFLISFLE